MTEVSAINEAQAFVAREHIIRELLGTDEIPGTLDNYGLGVYNGMIFWMCRRDHPAAHVHLITRNFEGSQENLTLGEMATAALEHEREFHGYDVETLPEYVSTQVNTFVSNPSTGERRTRP